MSRKKKKNRPRDRRPAAEVKFTLEMRVCVKPGIEDPDFPDIPLGGWSGTIAEIDERSLPPVYLIKWDQRTLEAMHPVYSKRCERDDLEVDKMWLDEDDIEPDQGNAPPIELPARVTPPALRMHDQDDRIRAVLGLTADDPLPDADEDNLRNYHDYLEEHLVCPFPGTYEDSSASFESRKQRVRVTGLLDFSESDLKDGILCTALADDEEIVVPLSNVEVRSSGPNRVLIEDYAYWFHNCSAHGSFPSDGGAAASTGMWTFLATLCGGVGLCGMVIGSAMSTFDDAAVAVKTGAILLGCAGGIAGPYSFPIPKKFRLDRSVQWTGIIFFACLGVLAGALAGALLTVFMGALLGGLVGLILGKTIGGFCKWSPETMWWGIAGAMLGVVVRCWLHDSENAWTGIWIGTLTGIVTVPVVLLAALLTMLLLTWKQR